MSRVGRRDEAKRRIRKEGLAPYLFVFGAGRMILISNIR